jgi:hypothetical protein
MVWRRERELPRVPRARGFDDHLRLASHFETVEHLIRLALHDLGGRFIEDEIAELEDHTEKLAARSSLRRHSIRREKGGAYPTPILSPLEPHHG